MSLDPRSYADCRFWTKDGDDIATTVFQNARYIRMQQDYRRKEDLLHASLYGDVQLFGFTPTTHSVPAPMRGSQLSLNIVHNMIGACLSRIACKAKPKPDFITKGADWTLSRRANRLEKACDGVFNQVKFYPKSNMAFRDGAIFGSGHIRWGAFVEANRVYANRMLPGELLISDREGLYGDDGVRTAYFGRFYDKVVLAEMFSDAEEQIMAAKLSDYDDEELGFDRTSEQVLVREAWRLPSWPGAKDGMWARCIDGKLLGKPLKYTRDRLPIASWRWDDGITGVFGRGLAYELRGIQLEINDILDELQDLLHTVKGKWLIEEMSRVNPNDLSDEGDAILMYRGTAPMYITPSVAPPELYQHLWNLVQKAYEISGISQLAATSQKPGGINSGAGLRAYRDQQSERFLDKFESWDSFIMRNTECAIDAMRDLVEATGKDLVLSSRRGEDLKSSDFLLAENVYELQIAPTSMIPSTPAGKVEFAEDMANMGIADPEELLELVSMPDTERFVERRLATRKLVEEMLEEMIDSNNFEPPEPYMFWPTAMKVAVETHLMQRRKKAPPEILDLISRWIVLANMQRQKEAVANASPPPPPGPPDAPPPLPGPVPAPPMAV